MSSPSLQRESDSLRAPQTALDALIKCSVTLRVIADWADTKSMTVPPEQRLVSIRSFALQRFKEAKAVIAAEGKNRG